MKHNKTGKCKYINVAPTQTPIGNLYFRRYAQMCSHMKIKISQIKPQNNKTRSDKTNIIYEIMTHQIQIIIGCWKFKFDALSFSEYY